MRSLLAFIRRVLAALRLLARDDRIPAPLRWVAGIGLLPIPGPIDEAVLLLVAPVFVVFYREPMREAWARSCRDRVTQAPAGPGPGTAGDTPPASGR